jgi:hypothetical protein
LPPTTPIPTTAAAVFKSSVIASCAAARDGANVKTNNTMTAGAATLRQKVRAKPRNDRMPARQRN